MNDNASHCSGKVCNLWLSSGESLVYELDRKSISPNDMWRRDLVLRGRWESLFIPEIRIPGMCRLEIRTSARSTASVVINGTLSRSTLLDCQSVADSILVRTFSEVTGRVGPVAFHGFDSTDCRCLEATYRLLANMLGNRQEETRIIRMGVERPVVGKSTLVWPRRVSPSVPEGFSLLAHEMSHFWWKENVAEVWLREGLAHYCQMLAIEMVFGAAARDRLVDRFIQGLRSENLTGLGDARLVDISNENPFHSRIIRYVALPIICKTERAVGRSVFLSVLAHLAKQPLVRYEDFRDLIQRSPGCNTEAINAFETPIRRLAVEDDPSALRGW